MFHMMVVKLVGIMECRPEVWRNSVKVFNNTVPSLFYVGKVLVNDFNSQQSQNISPTKVPLETLLCSSHFDDEELRP